MTIQNSWLFNVDNNSGGYQSDCNTGNFSRVSSLLDQRGRKEDDLGYKCYYTQAPLIFRVNSQWAFSAGLLLPLPIQIVFLVGAVFPGGK